MKQINTDVLVIGSDGAGLTAATVAAVEGAHVRLQRINEETTSTGIT